MGAQVSREPPPPTTKQLAAQQKENERQAKERASEACQQQLAAAIEAGELEALREAIDAADLAGCSAPLLKQARGRRDALRKAARRLERQAAGAQGEEEARQQREQRAMEATVEEDKARVEAAKERAIARQVAVRAEEERVAAAATAQAERARRLRLLEEQEVAERKAKLEAAEEAARLVAAERAPACGDQQVQSAATGDDAVGAVAHLLGQASSQVPAGSSDAGAAAPVATVATVALDRPPWPPAPSSYVGGRGRGRDSRGGRGPRSWAAIATGDDAAGAVAHLLGQASLQVPAGSSDAGAASLVASAASVALDRSPAPPAAVTSLADAQFSTGRPEVPESTIGGQTTCIVCFVNPKSHVAVPCGHQCACGDCSAKMKECPVCRSTTLMWMHVRVA